MPSGRVAAVSMQERIDTGQLKNKLNYVLGKEGSRYWEVVAAFLQNKCTKTELDATVKFLLREHVSLHNEFIKAIICNAVQGTAVPPVQKHSKKKKMLEDAMDGGGLGMMEEQTKKEKKMSKKLKNQQLLEEAADKKTSAAPAPFNAEAHWLTTELQRQQFTICDGADLYDQSWELPSLVTLRRRMKKKCLDHGLTDVSNAAVEYMQTGLDYYLRQVLRRCIRVARYRKTQESDEVVVTPADMHLTVQLHPGLLGQEYPTNVERTATMQY